ncbi:hypothetical protein [Cystobacter fuscus]|uniref:hypothetical protein n=1 Tax=Cystobacter fuscus TaxID=43 RepID=UPI0012DF5BCB|nr:hypothetical protein [Cystobacter fuscus]
MQLLLSMGEINTTRGWPSSLASTEAWAQLFEEVACRARSSQTSWEASRGSWVSWASWVEEAWETEAWMTLGRQ